MNNTVYEAMCRDTTTCNEPNHALFALVVFVFGNNEMEYISIITWLIIMKYWTEYDIDNSRS